MYKGRLLDDQRADCASVASTEHRLRQHQADAAAVGARAPGGQCQELGSNIAVRAAAEP